MAAADEGARDIVGNNNLLKKNLSQWLRVTQPPAATSHQ